MRFFSSRAKAISEPPVWNLSHMVPEFEGCETVEEYKAVFDELVNIAMTFSEGLTQRVQGMNAISDAENLPDVASILSIFEDQTILMHDLARISMHMDLLHDEHYQNSDFSTLKNYTDSEIRKLNIVTSAPLRAFHFSEETIAALIQNEPDLSRIATILGGTSNSAEVAPQLLEIQSAESEDPRLVDYCALFDRVNSDEELMADEEAHTQAITDMFNARLFQVWQNAKANDSTPDRLASEREGLPKEFFDELIALVPEYFADDKALDHYWDAATAARDGEKKSDYPPLYRRTFSWEEAADLIIRTFENFHPEMGELARTAFQDGWIHAKNTGEKFYNPFSQYLQTSQTWPGNHPYILTNFGGSFADVRNLTHELGHGIAEYLRGETVGEKAITSTALHETFARFSEMLLSSQLYQEESSHENKAALKLELFNNALHFIAGEGVNLVEHKLYQAAAGDLTPALSSHDIALYARDSIAPFLFETSEEGLEEAAKQPDYVWLSQIGHNMQIICNNPYYNTAYTLAEIGAMNLSHCYGELDEDRKREFADSWVNVMRNAPEHSYGSAMKEMGFTVTSPRALLETAKETLTERITLYAQHWNKKIAAHYPPPAEELDEVLEPTNENNFRDRVDYKRNARGKER